MTENLLTALPRRLLGYLELAWLVLARGPALGEPLTRLQLHAQIQATGLAALPTLGILAALAGAAALTKVTALTGQDNTLAQRFLFFGLVYELAPLLTALVVVARNSAVIASELAIMQVHDEFTALRRMGVPPANYLVLPRVYGLMLALPVATLFFQAVAVGSGWLAVALVQDQPLPQLALHFLDTAPAWLLIASVIKSAVTGAVIGIIACYHGSTRQDSTQAVTRAAIQAVGGGMVAVFVVDALFGAIVYAVLEVLN